MNDKIERFLKDRSYEFAVAFSDDGQEILRKGSVEGLPWKGLADTLVGTSDAVSRLADSVPKGTFQIFGQGKLRAVAFRLRDGLLLVLFDEIDMDAVESYRQAKSAMEELLLAFASQ